MVIYKNNKSISFYNIFQRFGGYIGIYINRLRRFVSRRHVFNSRSEVVRSCQISTDVHISNHSNSFIFIKITNRLNIIIYFNDLADILAFISQENEDL